MSIDKKQCRHYGSSKLAVPRRLVCEECGVDAPLRVCLECGHVGCCETTRGHAKAHAVSEKHPVIRQMPLRDASFTWCYECNDYLR